MGVEIKLNQKLGRDFTLENLRNQFSAVFLAIGAWKSVPLGVPGEELKGVVPALDLLKRINLGEKVEVPARAVVVGGGNAAVDAARILLRMGAEEVHLVYRRTRGEMPAISEEIEDGEKEGVIFDFLMTPLEIIGDENGQVSGIKLQRMRLGDFDRSGRRKPVPIEGAEELMKCDLVVSAIGQVPEADNLGERMPLDYRGNIAVNPYTLATSLSGVFAGGDAIGKEATVVNAMALGKKAAFSIHDYLQAGEEEEEKLVEIPKVGAIEEPPVMKETPRVKAPKLSPQERVCGFAEVKLCLSETDAREEAERCLRCDLEKVMKKYQQLALVEEEE